MVRGPPGARLRPVRRGRFPFAEQRWADIENSYPRTQREDPDGWRDYLGELAEVTAGERDTTAAQEWPEYNQ